jgi:hypothetical protein
VQALWFTDEAAVLAALSTLLVKRGVSLGALPPATMQAALGAAMFGVPHGAVLNERQINDTLQSQLAGPLQCLSLDHVEMRRWLVDSGWMSRDGFGREYRRTPNDQLAPALRQIAQALLGLDLPTWVVECQQHELRKRAARKQAWSANDAPDQDASAPPRRKSAAKPAPHTGRHT